MAKPRKKKKRRVWKRIVEIVSLGGSILAFAQFIHDLFSGNWF